MIPVKKISLTGPWSLIPRARPGQEDSPGAGTDGELMGALDDFGDVDGIWWPPKKKLALLKGSNEKPHCQKRCL